MLFKYNIDEIYNEYLKEERKNKNKKKNEINNRVYVCWDLHWAETYSWDSEKLSPKKWKESKVLNKNDILIILWDFGFFFTRPHSQESREKIAKLLKDVPTTIAFVPGNHENYDFIFGLPTEIKWWGEVFVYEHPDTKEKIYALKRGEVYNIEWHKILAIWGALSIDKAAREEDKTWWALEYLTEEEKKRTVENIRKHKWIFDYILSHTPPIWTYYFFLENWYYDNPKLRDEVAIFLQHIYDKYKLQFKVWYAGHLHIDKCILDWKFCCLYNHPPIRLK